MLGAVRFCLSAGLAVLLASTTALANGRFPRAQRLQQDASEPSRLALYGTYGLVTSTDAGQSWSYVCEAATGPFAGEAPLLELLDGGRIVLSSEVGLRAATFPACDWTGLLEPMLPDTVQDVTRDPTNAAGLWALLSQPDVSVGYRSALSRSDDAGATWSEGVPVPGEALAQPLTVDVARSRPERVYLSGLDDAKQGVLARSDDAGETWQGFPMAGLGASELPYLAEIDARQADHVFVRTDVLKDFDGQLQPDDALFFSADGGESFTRVVSRRAKLLGFAISPDGETILLGYGDPVLFAYTVEHEQSGLYRLRTADLLADPNTAASKLTKIFAGSVTCLRWTEHGLYACLAQAEQGFELGRADDAEFSLAEQQPFTPLLDLRALTPLACNAESSAAKCGNDPNLGWPAVCAKLGADCTATLGAAGAAGASGTAGTDSSASDPASCGCRLAPSRNRERLALWALFLGASGVSALAFRRWRRSRRQLDINAG
jgi:hypothetical protein